MAPKAKSSPTSLIQGKAYAEHVKELYQSTPLQPRDVDQKMIQLLDALHKAGKAEDGCKHVMFMCNSML